MPKILVVIFFATIILLNLKAPLVYANEQIESFTPISQELGDVNPDSTNLTIDGTWQIIDESNAGSDIGATINTFINSGITKFYLKNGTYTSSTTVEINQPGIIITGESKDDTIWEQTSTSISFKLLADNAILSYFTVKNLNEIAFYERDASSVTITETIINSGSTSSSIFFSGRTYPSGTDLVTMVASDTLDLNNNITNNTIISNYSGDGIYISNQDGCVFQNNTVSGSRLAFYLCRNSDVSNNSFTNSENNGIRICVPSNHNNISGNTISNTKASAILVTKFSNDLLDTVRGSQLTINDNTISNTNYFGIELSRLDDSNIQNNTITNVDFSGVYLLFNNNLNLTGNNVINSNRYTVNMLIQSWNTSLNAGFFADYKVQNCNFENNTQTNLENNCPYGIRIQPGSDNLGNIIKNNTTNGLFYNDFYLSSSEVTEITNTKNLSTDIIPTPLLTTSSTSSSIEVVWNTNNGYDNYDIEADGNIIHCGNVNSYLDSNLPLNSTYKYRVRISGGYWSDYITASTYVADINVNASTSTGSYHSEWTNEDVTLTLEGISSYDKFQYSFTPNNASSWVDIIGNTLTLSNDQDHCMYYFRAIDATQNVLSQTNGTEINIDKTTPSLIVDGNPTQYINTPINLTILPTVGISGIEKITASKNQGTLEDITNQSVYTISENGEYLFTLTNKASISTTFPLSVTKIDTVAPDINISGNPESWTNKDVTLDFTKLIGSSGILSVTVSNESGILFDLTNLSTYTVSENGIYTFSITNGLGLQKTKSINVSKIDKVVPTITLETLPLQLPLSTIRVSLATTSGISGIASIIVQKDEEDGKNITGQNTYDITEPGSYVFTVTSGAGEKSSSMIKLNDNAPIDPIEDKTTISDLIIFKKDMFTHTLNNLPITNKLSPFIMIENSNELPDVIQFIKQDESKTMTPLGDSILNESKNKEKISIIDSANTTESADAIDSIDATVPTDTTHSIDAASSTDETTNTTNTSGTNTTALQNIIALVTALGIIGILSAVVINNKKTKHL